MRILGGHQEGWGLPAGLGAAGQSLLAAAHPTTPGREQGNWGVLGGAPRAAWLRGPVARHGRVAGRLEPSILLPRAG